MSKFGFVQVLTYCDLELKYRPLDKIEFRQQLVFFEIESLINENHQHVWTCRWFLVILQHHLNTTRASQCE